MENGFLGLQNRPSLLKSSDYVHVLANLTLLQQGEQPLLQLVCLYGVSLMKGVQTLLLRHDIWLLFGKLGPNEGLFSY
jgi:hypothetical protein